MMMELQHYPEVHDIAEVPMSRTHQYRKVMKPLLERKRRARINKCLDELKDLMVYALQSEGESITKLEKADVLELTVKHLHKLKRQRQLQANPAIDMDRYRAGYTACANEVSRCLATVPGVDVSLGTNLMAHLGMKLKNMEDDHVQNSDVKPLSVAVPASKQQVSMNTAPQPLLMKAPLTPNSSADGGYSSGRDSVSPRSSISPSSPEPINFVKREMNSSEISSTGKGSVWRPF